MLGCTTEEKSHDRMGCVVNGPDDVSRPAVPTELTELAATKVLVDGCSHLDELNRTLLQTAELYKSGDSSKGLESFMALIGGMERFVNSAATAGQLLKLDFAGTSCGGQTLTESVETLNGILLEIIVAQQRRDWVLLTDLIEYELAPQIKLWLDIFTALRPGSVGRSGENLCS